MEPCKEFAWSFCLGLMFALFLIIVNFHITKLLQKLIFTFSKEKNLVMSEVAQRLGRFAS